ncbi:coiled-coil domain-containing protein [Mycolicibacterium helvum]|uniref:Glycoside hydrolase n=1 Tax=Mycolicibacterium helvum TaxID=1534349 RepID=A0A7I7T6B4_9MYCO|nr:glycoside hydrolase [Mycolicibacterium helvum]BBY64041.1 glycoside hydrolase [Mycolicibacterium helvum]
MRHTLRRTAVSVATGAAVLAASIVQNVWADPASDALAELNKLSREAVQTREAVSAAQRDVDGRLADQTAAEERHLADLAAVGAANAELEPYQAAVDRLAAITYMSGGTGQFVAVLTATSPQDLIDRLSLHNAIAGMTADQMRALRAARDRAAAAANASEVSAAEARAAAERAASVRADLQAKWSDLQRQILAAEAQYAALTPRQQAMVDIAAAALPAAQSPGDVAGPPLAAMPVDVPEALPIGVANEAGLQANTVIAARAISAQFPQIAEIDGVRPDPKPWHPRGLAIDVMIPNAGTPEGIALGDAILAFVMSNAGRFGLQDAIWRGTYYTPGGPAGSGYGHFDHVHVTTTPRG